MEQSRISKDSLIAQKKCKRLERPARNKLCADHRQVKDGIRGHGQGDIFLKCFIITVVEDLIMGTG